MMTVRVCIKNSVLRCYLASLLEKYNDGYIASMDTLTGTLICSLAKVCENPITYDDQDCYVTFYISNSSYNASLRNKHLFLTKEGQQKVISAINREFEAHFMLFCAESKMLGTKTEEIIRQFIIYYGMDVFDGDIDALKKRFYRRECQVLQKMYDKLKYRAKCNSKYIKEIITYSGKF